MVTNTNQKNTCSRPPPEKKTNTFPEPHYTTPDTIQGKPPKTLYKNKIKLDLVTLINRTRTNLTTTNSLLSLTVRGNQNKFTDNHWFFIEKHLEQAKRQLKKVN